MEEGLRVEKLNEYTSVIRATEKPLSADVFIFEGKESLWLFDVGNNPDILPLINPGGKKIKVILSHFHADHIGNLQKLDFEEVYVGKNTFNHTKCGTVVQSEIVLEDGDLKLVIFPMPSSHAKGSLALTVNDEVCFLGDSLYTGTKDGAPVYNVGLLKEQIECLKKVGALYLCPSHKESLLHKKTVILRWLEQIYSKREKEKSYINV